MTSTEIRFKPGLLEAEAIRPIYQVTAIAFKALFGYAPRENIEELLSAEWDRVAPKRSETFDAFYRDCLLVTEEVALWHQEKHGQRLRRVIHAGTIAKQLSCKTFCEVGAGIGTDGIALVKLGFECRYLAEINQHSCKMILRLAHFSLPSPVTICDLGHTTKEFCQRHFGSADWLYSSDVFEHIYDLEKWLGDWITNFKVVTVYAPFGKSDKNHAHTDYTKKQFNAFMAKKGFEKLRVRGLGIPPMVYRRTKDA